MSATPGPVLLTVADVAGITGCAERTVKGWIRSGELPALVFAGRAGYRVRLSDFEAFLDRRTLAAAVKRRISPTKSG